MMRATHGSSFDDVEKLRRRFEEFRSQHRTRTRLPEELWRAAAEMAGGRRDGGTARHKSGLPVLAVGLE
jgi:hypothetical protein